MLAHARSDGVPVERFRQQRVDEGAVGLGSPPMGFESWTEIASLAASGVGNATSAAGSGKGVRDTGMDAAAGGRDGNGRSAPLTAARGSPSWSASCTTLSSRSSARLFWYFR